MSYNLGEWWKQLTCDMCPKPPPPPPPDLGLPPDYHDPSWDNDDPYGLTDPSPYPEDDDDGIPEDDGLPGIPLPGGGSATPAWPGGPGFNLTWPW